MIRTPYDMITLV